MMLTGRAQLRMLLLGLALLLALPTLALAADSTAVVSGTVPFTNKPDTAYVKKHFFPLLQEKLASRLGDRQLPPPYGVMLLNNWMDSDWRFTSAAISLGGSNPISLDAAANATMDLRIGTRGAKADIWVLPFLNVFGGGGDVDIDAQLGLRDIPLNYDPVPGKFVYGDAIVPMEFTGSYTSLGFVLAYAYKHFYGAMDGSWVKTSLNGDASLSSDGFVTFTAAPKFGYNAGLSQLYIGARYVSKNEHYVGTVSLPSGNPLGFDVRITTDTWAPNVGMRTVIQDHWEFLIEVAGDPRHQISVGGGYRW
jgi:hypothetical protein